MRKSGFDDNMTKSTVDEANADLDALRGDIAGLQRDLAAALEHLKVAAARGAQPAAERSAAGAAGLYEDLSTQAERMMKSIGSQIEQQPLASVLIAFAIGFIFSRFSPR
jgi:ElaB/YqjD/DUF883 family membrane-anchored ribosome-binding protein